MTSVVWSDPALRDLRRVDADTRARITGAVNSFANTGHGDARPLTGLPGWHLRVGDWRVLFSLATQGADRTLTVLAVRRRDQAYR